MELNIENIISEITSLPSLLSYEEPSFKALEEKFDNNYEQLSYSLSKDVLLESIGILATMKLFKGIKAKDEQKSTALKEFRNYLNKSDKIEINQKRSFALKGFYYFYQGDFKQSIKYFDNSKDIDPYYLPQLLGRGLVEYQRKEYKLALNNFKLVFQFYRHMVPKCAYVMGLCYLNLNKLDLAEKCFVYMIKNNLGDLTANHIALAIIKYKVNDIDGYYEHMTNAFHSNPSIQDINLCLNLTEHYFFKKDFEKVAKLAKKGLKETEDLLGDYKNFDKSARNDYHELKSRFSYILGFIEHSSKSSEGLNEAYKHYKAALQSNSLNYAAQFGLSQIFYSQRNYVESHECLETILSKIPEHLCKDCYILLPHIYMRLNKEQKAYEAFDKVMKYFPNDSNVLIDYVSYLEVSNTKKALEIYEKILECSDKSKVQPEILNNMAVTFVQNNKFNKGLMILEKAKLEINNANLEPNKTQALELMIDYNIARLYQKQNLQLKAKKLYESIIEKNPLFYECYLHLAKIYLSKNNIELFHHNLNIAMFICYKTLSVSRIEYPFYIQVSHLINSQKYNEALDYISKIKKQDTFLLLYRASVFYNLVVYNRGNMVEAKRHIKHAAEICSLILRNKEEANNIYAANMVASLLAERGRSNDALTIFRSFQDILDVNSPLLYNMAIAEYVAGNFEKALIIFESPKSYYKLKYDTLYGILNILLEKYSQAEKIFKYRYLREPGLVNLYNYISCLHKRVKDLYVKKEVRIDDVELLKQSLEFCEHAFDFINHSISPKVATALDAGVDKAEIERRKLFELKKNSEKQVFYLHQNKESYQKMIEKELERRNQLKQSQEQRKKLIEMEKSKINQKVEEQQKMQLTKEELLELKAKEAMKMAESLLADLKVQQTEIKQPSRKVKKERAPSEDKYEDDELSNAKERKVKRISKKISKKADKIKKEESEEDSFIAGDITESEPSENERELRDSEFDERSDDEVIYDPLQNFRNDKNIQKPETKQVTRKLRKKHEVVRQEARAPKPSMEESENIAQSPSITESAENQPVEDADVKDLNEDIYIAKHRTKKLMIEEDDE